MSLKNISRRQLLATTGSIGLMAIAGCTTQQEAETHDDHAGHDEKDHAAPAVTAGVSMADLPPLEGSLTMYSGRKESLVG